MQIIIRVIVVDKVGLDGTCCNSNTQEAGESKVLGLARLHRLYVQRAKLTKRYKKLKRKRERKGKRLKVTQRSMEKEEDREREREKGKDQCRIKDSTGHYWSLRWVDFLSSVAMQGMKILQSFDLTATRNAQTEAQSKALL